MLPQSNRKIVERDKIDTRVLIIEDPAETEM